MKKRTAQKLNMRDERGFTIVEVLVSLIIFSIAVAGVITVAVQGGLNVNAAKLNLTATYLADEGTELMRAMRDTRVVGAGPLASDESAGWLLFTSPTTDGFGTSRCAVGAPCDIDPTVAAVPFPSLGNVVSCTGPDGYCPLYALDTGGYTDISTAPGAKPSPYSRQIVLIPNGDSDVKVTVNVRYQLGITTPVVTQSEDLFNWY